MIREELIFVAACDISGLARGKGFPARELPLRLTKGVGWTGSNLMMSPFGPIWDTPFGTAGDFMIVPDPAAEVRVGFGDDSAADAAQVQLHQSAAIDSVAEGVPVTR